VSFRLESDGEGTRLVFEHSGFDLSRSWSYQAVQGQRLSAWELDKARLVNRYCTKFRSSQIAGS